jgi:hypothetical protein
MITTPTITNTGIINLYDDYGDLSYKYFHVNGKINGEYIKYWQSYVNWKGEECEDGSEMIFYIDGVKQGKSTRITISNKLLEDCIESFIGALSLE